MALIIGNSLYSDPSLSRLQAPEADVSGLAEILRDPQVCAFDDVLTLVNQPYVTVRREIARFFANRTRDDLLLLYFSGHGLKDDRGRLYLAVRDTERELLDATAIEDHFVARRMDECRSRRMVLILDCCHSGAFGHKGAAEVNAGQAFAGNGLGRVTLTASDKVQYSWEGNRISEDVTTSIFTHYFIHGLRTSEADADGDGAISLNELYEYVYERVVEATDNKQTPGMDTHRQQGRIILRQLPASAPVRPAALPPELKHAIESPLPSVREAAVQTLAQLLSGSHRGLSLAAREALTQLAKDDSRRVSMAATQALSAAPAIPETKPESPPAPALAQSERPGEPVAAKAEDETPPKKRKPKRPPEPLPLTAESGPARHGSAITAETAERVKLWQDLRAGQGTQARNATNLPDGTVVAALPSAINPSEVLLWLVKDGVYTHTLSGHTNPVNTVNLSADGAVLASGAADTVRLWQVRDGKLLHTLHPARGNLGLVALSADGSRVACSHFRITTARRGSGESKTIETFNEHFITLWQVSDGQLLYNLPAQKSTVLGLNFTPDGSQLASAWEDKIIRVWRVSDGQLVHTLQAHTDRINAVTISRDGKLLASASSDRTVILWRLSDGALLHTLHGHTDRINCVAFSPDGTLAASGSHDQCGRVWSVKNGGRVHRLSGHTKQINCVAFSPDGSVLATGGGGEWFTEDSAIRLWRVSDGKLLKTLEAHTGTVWDVAFTPDGGVLASGAGDNTLKLWRVLD